MSKKLAILGVLLGGMLLTTLTLVMPAVAQNSRKPLTPEQASSIEKKNQG